MLITSKKMRIFTLLMVLFFANVSHAKSLTEQMTDSLAASHKLIFIDGTPTLAQQDSVRGLILSFYYDQFRHFSDPAAPYFMFMSKDATLAMGIGGCVRMRGYYDWGGAMPGSGFAPYLIPMQPDPTNMRHFDTTPAGSSLFFRIIGRNKSLGSYQLYIEANFNGYQNRDFHLKKAYAIVNDFTIGYASSTFSDPAAVPATVDSQGPNNKISGTSVLVRYMPTFKNRWTIAVSAETPSTQLATDQINTAKVSNWMPDFAAFVQYAWSQSAHVRLAGIYRTLSYRDLIKGQEGNHNIGGWGLQLSSVAHPVDQITTYVTANYGHGVAGAGGDLQIGNYDLVGDPERPGHMYAPATLGWCVGVQYNFRPNLFASVSMSESRYLPKHDVAGSEYKYGLFGAVNVFWNLTPRIQAGAELDLGKRKNFDGEHRSAKRFGLMAQFSF